MGKEGWGLDWNEVERIRGVLSAHPQVTQAIVYGSRAMGTHRPGSDIDLTLRGSLQWADLQRIETELDSLDMPYKIDLSIESQIENPELRRHIDHHGQPLYERETNDAAPEQEPAAKPE